jgi:hypothetical protein
MAWCELGICDLGRVAWPVYGMLCILQTVPEKAAQITGDRKDQVPEVLADFRDIQSGELCVGIF